MVQEFFSPFLAKGTNNSEHRLINDKNIEKLDNIKKRIEEKLKQFKLLEKKIKKGSDDSLKLENAITSINDCLNIAEIYKKVESITKQKFDYRTFEKVVDASKDYLKDIFNIFANRLEKEKNNNKSVNSDIDIVCGLYNALDKLNIFILGEDSKFEEIKVKAPIKVKKKDSYNIIRAFKHVSYSLKMLKKSAGLFRGFLVKRPSFENYDKLQMLYKKIRDDYIRQEGWVDSDKSKELNSLFKEIEELIPSIVVFWSMNKKISPSDSEKFKTALIELYDSFDKLYFEILGSNFKKYDFYNFIPHLSNSEKEEDYYISVLDKTFEKISSFLFSSKEIMENAKMLYNKHNEIKAEIIKRNNEKVEHKEPINYEPYIKSGIEISNILCELESKDIKQINKLIYEANYKTKDALVKKQQNYEYFLKVFKDLNSTYSLWFESLYGKHMKSSDFNIEYENDGDIYSAALQVTEKLSRLSELFSNLEKNITKLNKIGTEYNDAICKNRKELKKSLKKTPDKIENIFCSLYNNLVGDKNFKNLLYDEKFRNEFISDIYSNTDTFQFINNEIGNGQSFVSEVINTYSTFISGNDEFLEFRVLEKYMQEDLIDIAKNIMTDYEEIYKFIVDMTKSHAVKLLTKSDVVAKSLPNNEKLKDLLKEELERLNDYEELYSKKKVDGDPIIGNVWAVIPLSLGNTDDMSVDILVAGSGGETNISYSCGRGYCKEITSYNLDVLHLFSTNIRVYIAFKSASAVNLVHYMLKKVDKKKLEKSYSPLGFTLNPFKAMSYSWKTNNVTRAVMNGISNGYLTNNMNSLVQIKITNNASSGEFSFLPCNKAESIELEESGSENGILALELYQNLKHNLKSHKSMFMVKLFSGKTVYDELSGYMKKLSKNFRSANYNPGEAAEIIKMALERIKWCQSEKMYFYELKQLLNSIYENLKQVKYQPIDSRKILEQKFRHKQYQFPTDVRDFFEKLLEQIKSVKYDPSEIPKILKEKIDDVEFLYKNSKTFSKGIDKKVIQTIGENFKLLGNALVGEKTMNRKDLSTRTTNKCDIVGKQVFTMDCGVKILINPFILITLECHGILSGIIRLAGFKEVEIDPKKDDLGLLVGDVSINFKQKTSLWGIKFFSQLLSWTWNDDEAIMRIRVYVLAKNKFPLNLALESCIISTKSKKEIDLI